MSGVRVCPTGGSTISSTGGARPTVRGDECNEISLKFSPDIYLSTSLIPHTKIFLDRGPWPPGPPTGATPAGNYCPTARRKNPEQGWLKKTSRRKEGYGYKINCNTWQIKRTSVRRGIRFRTKYKEK
ncbi:hypothetical protein AVEN_35525-1 [Araneus ventricosus]|uniref:Uncharacterized protein n=1 Tax=Araneus ventricosus TaxID=182803 RepID=A0A4Y2PX90_ARAVE|nr:hypothetical protein AVEN_35525-1 [Araneus ventricosus]